MEFGPNFGYTIYYRGDKQSNFNSMDIGNVLTYTLNNVVFNSYYFIRVGARNRVGRSNIVNATIKTIQCRFSK